MAHNGVIYPLGTIESAAVYHGLLFASVLFSVVQLVLTGKVCIQPICSFVFVFNNFISEYHHQTLVITFENSWTSVYISRQSLTQVTTGSGK